MPKAKSENAYEKKLPHGWLEKARGLKTEELQKEIQQSARYIKEFKKEQKAHPVIREHQEAIDLVKKPYDDMVKVLDAKIAACHDILTGRGIVLDGTTAAKSTEPAKKAS